MIIGRPGGPRDRPPRAGARKWILVADMLVLIAALIRYGEVERERVEAAAHASVVNPVPAPEAGPHSSIVVSVMFVDSRGETRPLMGPLPSTATVLLQVALEGRTREMVLELRWSVLQHESSEDLGKASLAILGGRGELTYRAEAPQGGWPAGTHRIELLEGTTAVARAEFEVSAGPAAAGRASPGARRLEATGARGT